MLYSIHNKVSLFSISCSRSTDLDSCKSVSAASMKCVKINRIKNTAEYVGKYDKWILNGDNKCIHKYQESGFAIFQLVFYNVYSLATATSFHKLTSYL